MVTLLTLFRFCQSGRANHGRDAGRNGSYLRYSVFSFVALSLLVGGSGVSAQTSGLRFTHLSTKDGLSHNSVNAILQDSEGFMWFATNDGLNKYDGYSFTVHHPNSTTLTTSFHSNRVAGLCEDRSHRLWAVTEGSGLYEVEKKTGRMIPHPIRSVNAHRWNNQLSVYEDSQGMLWLSTYDGLARYDPAAHQFVLYPSPHREMPIKSVFEDPSHRLWIATSKGLYLFNRQSGQYALVPVSDGSGQQPVFVSFYLDTTQTLWLGTVGNGLYQIDLRKPTLRLMPYNPGGSVNRYVYLNTVRNDGRGGVWLGTTDGLQRVDPILKQVLTYRPSSEEANGLSSVNIQAVYTDRNGTLWIGTDNGIDEQASNRKAFSIYQVRSSVGSANFPENKVNTILVDQQNRLWLSNQHTVYRTDAARKRTTAVPAQLLGNTSTHTNYFFSLLPDSSGIWLSTWDGLYRYDAKTDRFTGYVSTIPGVLVSRAPDGKLWIGGDGTTDSGIASFDPRTHHYTYYKHDPANKNGLPDKFVYALLASRTGDIWIAINGKGISRLNPKTSRFTHYEAGLKAGQLNTNEVLTFYEDRQGIIWAGTNQGGLNRFDPKTGQFTHLTTQDGLPSNRVVGITGDQSGNLWVSTNKGLCRLDQRTNEIRHYDSNAGIPSNDFLENAVFTQPDRLYFGSLNGLVSFNPDSIQDNIKSFPVAITDFKVMNQSRPLTDSVMTLAHDENFLSFEFAALTYTVPQLSRYMYRLVGVDKTWIPGGTRHFANYTNLAPGTYAFQVKASTGDGVWSKRNASIHLTIRPPWWATYWAYGLYTLLFGGGIVGFLRVQTNRIRQRQEIDLRRREAEQLKAVDEVKSRFFSNITHEFRTPLSLIISPVETLLRDSALHPPIRQTLSLVNRNALHLLRLINQLLDLARLEAASMPVTLMYGQLDDFVQQITDSFESITIQKGVTLSYTRENLPAYSQFDADKWEKILVNLVSNAIKFTPAGGTVLVDLRPAHPSPVSESTAIQLVVSDTGTGISPEALPHIFNRFYQVDTSSTRAFEGTGIGLALVKELTELIGGTIAVESQVGRGTTFTLQLPVFPTTENEADGRPVSPKLMPLVSDLSVDLAAVQLDHPIEAVPVDRSSAPLVLLVEDNHDLMAFLANELAISYRVISASNGEEGWRLAQEELPDIIISDVMMPIMDGLELTRLIRNTPETDHIAVLLLTAKASLTSRMDGLELGADDYLSKPFHVAELQLRLRNLISRQQKLSEQYRQQLTQPDQPALSDGQPNPFLDRIYALLDSHLTDPILTVDWLADQLSMSRKTLYRKIDSLTGLAPNELIRQYRLRKAVDFLQAGHNVTETAYLVGFKTASHFTTVFKDHYKKTPSEFFPN
ncbi:hybrid sensor histidine kinase/response regulator [Spirosoma agri]|uniref:hybrid sensor histidine kinase/response regulator n=1 Tax=Spirosoma agri TaxID=1987381 RepID=UPI001FE4CCAF|nr:two-component regulator propeller domain-containing protein [Spirosoma agri]